MPSAASPSPRAVALVTGAGSPDGIGFASALRLARAGLHAVLVATSDRIHERAAELHALGLAATGMVADLRDEAAVAGVVADAEAIGAVEVLVNNAGMTSVAAGGDAGRRVIDMAVADWDDTLRRNLTSAFMVTRAVLPGMVARRYGRIVMVSSVSGPVVSFPGGGAYGAAKAGMVGLTRALAQEVARDGVTVNSVLPGWIDTPSASDREREAGAATPVGRSGTADEVAVAVAFFADRAASYVTGTVVVVDGGNSIVEDHAH
jgi:3-oxoacyl-[acyl-carrier protein] reductase